MCNILRSYFVNINNVAEMEHLTQKCTFLLQFLHNKNKYVIYLTHTVSLRLHISSIKKMDFFEGVMFPSY